MSIPFVKFFDASNMGVFFDNVKALMFLIMPLLLIWAATVFAGYFISVVRSAFIRSDKGHDRDDKEDYDIKIKEKY